MNGDDTLRPKDTPMTDKLREIVHLIVCQQRAKGYNAGLGKDDSVLDSDKIDEAENTAIRIIQELIEKAVLKGERHRIIMQIEDRVKAHYAKQLEELVDWIDNHTDIIDKKVNAYDVKAKLKEIGEE